MEELMINVLGVWHVHSCGKYNSSKIWLVHILVGKIKYSLRVNIRVNLYNYKHVYYWTKEPLGGSQAAHKKQPWR